MLVTHRLHGLAYHGIFEFDEAEVASKSDILDLEVLEVLETTVSERTIGLGGIRSYVHNVILSDIYERQQGVKTRADDRVLPGGSLPRYRRVEDMFAGARLKDRRRERTRKTSEPRLSAVFVFGILLHLSELGPRDLVTVAWQTDRPTTSFAHDFCHPAMVSDRAR